MAGRLAICVVAWLAGLPAAAETIGTITATLDGGAERTWYVIAEGGQGQSGWAGILPGTLNGASFQLWGNPAEGDLAGVKDTLALGAVLMRGPGGTVAIAEVGYLEDGFSRHWLSLEETPVEMTLERADLDGGVLHVAGSFAARLHYTEDPAGQQVDTSRAMTVSGRFEAALPQN